ncbi:MAG: caspase family protein [Cyclobacteriaceae bacterium]|jgi:tetratricopeptide (TPR) repeat protein|nr:caspase family protein [Cyclobacteriaceae bacterium]MDH4297496.1 caspase family protein [Cyclobacteriaceae bacterium]MDH5248443.1 caspase family protein [Cyclobacteriaceae bacterium]
MKSTLRCLCLLVLVTNHALAQGYKDFDAGVAKFRAEEYNAVIEMFSAMLSDPRHDKRFDEDLHFYRGQSYYHVNEYTMALDDLNQSLTLGHYNRGVLCWYQARCYDKLGKKSEATASYKEALTNAEKNKKIAAQILADRAQFLARNGDNVAAEQDLALAKSLDPANKDISGVSVATQASPNRNAGAQNKSQIIITKNAAEESKKGTVPVTQPQQNTQPPAATASQSNAELVSALAAAYKDEKRYALVIGNSNYGKEIGLLKNPLNDATDVATELRKSDFDVQLVTNATYVQMREAMRKFHEKLTDGPRDQTVGLFYYAGHGVAYQDENYLVPIDAEVKYEDDIARMCFPVQRMVLANMERSNSRMNIVILDACRNNPFPATSRSISSGLGEMKRARGSFIAYATSPGSVASDGSGRNGLYTQELLKALRKPGLSIEQVFKEVRMNVLRLSGDKQYTWDSSNIIGEFYFKFQ